MSMAMLVSIVVVILLVLVFVLRSQKKLFQANAEARARSIFLANMSHEIRTPLNGIIGLIFLMEKDLKNGAEKSLVKQRLQKAKATAEYLLSLINNILDISKLQAGKVELNQEPLSLEVLLDDILSMQKSSIESRKIHFVVNKEITVPWIIGDNLMIKQVLLNILSNAAKFTPPEGQITFSVEQMREEERRVTTVFTCADTGCGMSEEFQKHIWDSFTQERKKNENSIKGTGLGMAISRLLMQAMGGEIEVQSRLGMGSTFYVILHSEIALQSPEYRIVQKEIQRSDPSQNEKMRILVAEDNELNAEILLEILQSEGYETTYACNGQEAVEKFEQSAPGEIQVILMDMQMPLMDGCEATKEIRSLDRPDAATVLIFACTANNFNEDRERAEACGMNDFLSKPIDVKEMFMKLGRSS
jgi:CheY-like chemotaxis protein/nitrogen-specific signal transduction histidine kinase